jgi:hypothetical protein
VEREVIEPEEVKENPEAFRCIGEEVTEMLDYQPAKFFRRQIIRRKFVRRQEPELAPFIAPLPESLQQRCVAAPGLLAQVIVSKYCDHHPLYAAPGIKWHVIGIFADHRIDNDPITGQGFLNDPNRRRRALNALFFTVFAGTLFALSHHHEVFGRFHIELLALLVTDHTVSLPQLPHTHCSGVQAMIFSMRGKCAGNSSRPGCFLTPFCDRAQTA